MQVALLGEASASSAVFLSSFEKRQASSRERGFVGSDSGLDSVARRQSWVGAAVVATRV